MRLHLYLLPLAAALSHSTFAGDADRADLRVRIRPNEILHYAWTINSSSASSGREQGRAFTLTSESIFGLTLILKGLPQKHEGSPVSVRLHDFAYTDRRSIGADSKTELVVSKGRIKYTENGKLLVDSENDIGAERLAGYQQHIKNLENSEMRTVLDFSGRQNEVTGDSSLVETVKSGGAHGIFPILAGKEVAPGESWEDSFSMPQIGDFKLARSATVRSKMKFSRWVLNDGKSLAEIELVSAWDKQDLRGESEGGLLVEITRVDGRGTGTCLFDPATGHFVNGSIDVNVKYRIDGELDGQTTGLDVSGKTHFTFQEKPE